MPVKEGPMRGLKPRPSEIRPIRRRIRARKVTVKPKKVVNPDRGIPLHLRINDMLEEK